MGEPLQQDPQWIERVGRIGWFAPGGYARECSVCGCHFCGDKRAQHCLPCAIETLRKERDALRARVEVLEGALRPFAKSGRGVLSLIPGTAFANARAALNLCRECGTPMTSGRATGQTYVGGSLDFPSDPAPVTISAGGPGELIDCMKCPECGWSVSK